MQCKILKPTKWRILIRGNTAMYKYVSATIFSTILYTVVVNTDLFDNESGHFSRFNDKMWLLECMNK